MNAATEVKAHMSDWERQLAAERGDVALNILHSPVGYFDLWNLPNSETMKPEVEAACKAVNDFDANPSATPPSKRELKVYGCAKTIYDFYSETDKPPSFPETIASAAFFADVEI